MPAGRPLKFKTVESLQEQCDEYFESCWKITYDNGNEVMTQVKPYLITGLALSLKTTRQTLINYECKPEFLDTIKAAKLKCESYAEEMALTGKNQAGAIFALKNYGWKDKREIEVNDISDRSEDELRSKLNELLGTTGSGGNS